MNTDRETSFNVDLDDSRLVKDINYWKFIDLVVGLVDCCTLWDGMKGNHFVVEVDRLVPRCSKSMEIDTEREREDHS